MQVRVGMPHAYLNYRESKVWGLKFLVCPLERLIRCRNPQPHCDDKERALDLDRLVKHVSVGPVRLSVSATSRNSIPQLHVHIDKKLYASAEQPVPIPLS